ncbi:hypothetical protein EVAR_29342_1 [Eumeta japonica]|uniref:Uncharacterized protein n=1 Tax=Eumeta variegata TaxID=151549 RepID=A0A4C1WHQ1_EUMVA|nr:hypothetical protein EVAR_29342_1 [Eumeta japonica]
MNPVREAPLQRRRHLANVVKPKSCRESFTAGVHDVCTARCLPPPRHAPKQRRRRAVNNCERAFATAHRTRGCRETYLLGRSYEGMQPKCLQDNARNIVAVKFVTKPSQWRKIGTRRKRKKVRGA